MTTCGCANSRSTSHFLQHAQKILSELKELRKEHDLPVVFGGDFNLIPQNILYRILFERPPIDDIDFIQVLPSMT